METTPVTVINVVKATQRIPEELKHITFFGYNDFWEYQAVYDDVICDACEVYDEMAEFPGHLIRAFFPNLEIRDENLIHVKVHPHCRCRLTRIQ